MIVIERNKSPAFLLSLFLSVSLLALKLSLLTFTLMLGLFGVEFGLEGSFLLGS